MSHKFTDEQGNILARHLQQLEIQEDKRSSTVFSWPAFVNSSPLKEVIVPIKNPVHVRDNDSIRSALWSMIKNKIQCLPVYNESTKKYIGFIDIYDIVKYIFNAAGPATVKPDFFQVFKRQPFGDTPVYRIIRTLGKGNSAYIAESSYMDGVFDLTVSLNLHHIPVMVRQKLVGMISQARVVQYLAENIPNFSDLASTKLKDLNLSGTDNVYIISDNVPSITAFAYMSEKGVRGLAVVNAEGQYIDSINSFDVEGLVHGDFFSDLRQPILRYLSKSRILLGRRLDPIVCNEEETLADALQKMGKENISRIFVINSNRKPVQTISLRDILKALHSTPTSGPTTLTSTQFPSTSTLSTTTLSSTPSLSTTPIDAKVDHTTEVVATGAGAH